MTYSFDFTRCVRPDGSAYGTSGSCKKGVEQEKQAINQLLSLLPKGERVVSSTGKEFSRRKGPAKASEELLSKVNRKLNAVNRTLEHEQKVLKRMSSAKKYESIRERRLGRIEKLKKAQEKLRKKITELGLALDAEAQRSGLGRPLMPPNWTPPVKETLNLPRL